MSTIQLRCCDNNPVFEIEYQIGSTYQVCQDCLKMKHFARGIKSKNKLASWNK